MNRRPMMLAALAILATGFGTAQGDAPRREPAASSPEALAKGDKPNILFIFADDMSWECVRSVGLDEVKTPNLDRLVSRGTTFTRAYNMGSWSGQMLRDCGPSL